MGLSPLNQVDIHAGISTKIALKEVLRVVHLARFGSGFPNIFRHQKKLRFGSYFIHASLSLMKAYYMDVKMDRMQADAMA